MTTAPARVRSALRPARTLSEHVTSTFALALPMMFGRAGLLIAITVALVVVGHAGPNDQAYFAAGFALHMLVLVFGMGLVAGITVSVGPGQRCWQRPAVRPYLAARPAARRRLRNSALLSSCYGAVPSCGLPDRATTSRSMAERSSGHWRPACPPS